MYQYMFPWVSISDTVVYLQLSIFIFNMALSSDLNTSTPYSQQRYPIELYPVMKIFQIYIVQYNPLCHL